MASERAMGLMDVFKKKTPLEKASQELGEKFAQPEYRRNAMAKLIEIGTLEAHLALLKRFTFNCNGHIADEEEKRDLVNEIVRIGEPMIAPLKNFIREQKTIGFPIRALGRLQSKEEVRDFLVETLTALEPLDHRTTEQKRALIIALGDLGFKETSSHIVPYLDDHSDDVQFQAVEALEELADPDAGAAIVEVCVGDEHGGRIQRRAAQALVNLGVPARARFDAFNEELKSEYYIAKKGMLVKKTGQGSDGED